MPTYLHLLCWLLIIGVGGGIIMADLHFIDRKEIGGGGIIMTILRFIDRKKK